jgi:hypothetical protein
MSSQLATLLNSVNEALEGVSVAGVAKIAGICIAVAFLWPIVQEKRKIYDISMINHLEESCKFETLRAQAGAEQMGSSADNTINSQEVMHYQVVPSWRGVFGSNTLHIKLTKEDKTSVIIPVYNSGDIQRSRLFFIERNGVREGGTEDREMWTWCKDHHFGQQGN